MKLLWIHFNIGISENKMKSYKFSAVKALIKSSEFRNLSLHNDLDFYLVQGNSK